MGGIWAGEGGEGEGKRVKGWRGGRGEVERGGE